MRAERAKTLVMRAVGITFLPSDAIIAIPSLGAKSEEPAQREPEENCIAPLHARCQTRRFYGAFISVAFNLRVS